MKTKFTKVAVEERLPTKNGNYFCLVKNGDALITCHNTLFKNYLGITHWLEESPDREDEMIAILKEIHFDHFWNGNPLSIDIKTKLESLLQSLKQEK